MKTKLIFAALLFVFTATFAQANSSKKMLHLVDSFGRHLFMPVQADEAPEALPFDAADIFHRTRMADVNKIFDLSTMTKPEADADDIDIDLKAVYEETTKNR
ncbi:MAG: hypothetical protein R6U64_05180 [Bacteroidales bacterium]